MPFVITWTRLVTSSARCENEDGVKKSLDFMFIPQDLREHVLAERGRVNYARNQENNSELKIEWIDPEPSPGEKLAKEIVDKRK